MKTDFKIKKGDNKKLAELQAKCDEYLNGWKRAKADYENLKKETEQRIIDLKEFATAGLILDILPVYSHFKLACQHIPGEEQKKDWVKGILHIKREFEELLKKFEITEIKTVGEKFNPEFHEAVSHQESEKEEDIIFKEVKSGYLLNGKVIQPAKVIVSKNLNNSNKDDQPQKADSSAKGE